MACVLIDADTSETSLAPLPWHYRRTSREGNRWGEKKKKRKRKAKEKKKKNKNICKKCLTAMPRSRFIPLAQPCQSCKFALSQPGAHNKLMSFKYASHNN